MKYKKEITGIITSIIFSVIISIIIYNYRVLVKYVFGIETFSLSNHAIVRFICYFFFSVFFSFGLNIRNKIFILFLPVFLIDITTLVNGRELIPLRFPFDTIYPLLGIISGTYYRTNKRIFMIFFSLSFLFIVISHYHLRPLILWKMYEKNQHSLSKNIYVDDTYITTTGSKVALKDTLKSSPSLLEFYFVGCLPCEPKYTALKKIHDIFQDNLKLILICDGQASTYNSFLKHWEKNEYKNIIFLYDDRKNLVNYNITGYPTELLIDSNSIITHISQGFGEAISDKWLKKENYLIEKLIKK